MEQGGHRIKRLFRAFAAVTLIGGTFGGAASLLAASPASALNAANVTDPGSGAESSGVAFTITAVDPGVDDTADPGSISWTDVNNTPVNLAPGDALPTPSVASACVFSGGNTTCTIPGVVLGAVDTHNLTVTIGSSAQGTDIIVVTAAASVCSMGTTSLTGVSGTPQSAPPGTIFPQALQVKVTCSNSVNPAGQTVNFSTDNASVATPASSTATVGSDGIAQVAASAVGGGSTQIHASYGTQLSTADFSLKVVGGPSGSDFGDCGLNAQSGTPQSTPQSAFFQQALTATLHCTTTDPNDQQVTFSEVSPNAGGTDVTFTSGGTVSTDSNGVAEVAVQAGSTSGTVVVQATYGITSPTHETYTLYITGGTITSAFPGCTLAPAGPGNVPPAGNNNGVGISGNNQNANQGAPFTQALAVTLSGCINVPNGGQLVKFTQTGGSGTVTFTGGTTGPASVTATTGPDGVASVAATAGTGGSVTITASYAGGASTQTFSLTVVAPGVAQSGCTIAPAGPGNVPPAGNNNGVGIAGNNQTATVGTTFAQPISVTVDCTGASISPLGQQVQFSGSNVSFTAGGVGVADSNGKAQVAVSATSNPVSNPVTVTATYGSTTQTFSLYITGGSTPIGSCSFTTANDNQTTLAGTPFAHPLQVTLNCGSLSAANEKVQFVSATPGAVTFVPSSGIIFTDSSGKAVIPAYAGGSASGTEVVNVLDGNGTQKAQFTNLVITSPSAPNTSCSLVSPQGDGQFAPVNTYFTQALQITLSCTGGISPAGQTVTFSVYSGSGSIGSNPTVTLGSDGKATAAIKAGPTTGPLVIKALYGPNTNSPQVYYFNLTVA